ncbi:hypothetical protein GY45DRAFT_1370798 [Cubamyces sp. BRFM 1775]|nr:hypothetical protein GY45DRAFT_1370798 [Cubamyces sp. BRFM 1775]
MSGLGQANVTPDLPRIWTCNWGWCPETFRRGSELSKHLNEVHFKKIVKVRKRDLSAYLRSVRGDSGATDSLLAAFLPTPPVPAGHNETPPETPTTDARTSSAPQHYPIISTASHEPPMREPSPQPFKGPQSPTNSNLPHTNDPRADLSSSPMRGERSSKSPASDATSSTSDVRSAKRRRTSFATYAAQSSPMSTPSVASMPPSPALSNMITDAINAAGRINSGSPGSVSPRKPLSSASATNGRPRPTNQRPDVLPLPRRTSLGASPTPDRPRISSQSKAPGTSSISVHASSVARAKHVQSPDSNSVASAQAVEEVLTQDISAAASPQPRAGSLQYPSQSDSSGRSVESEQLLQYQQEASPSQATSYYGSHAVESVPRSQPYPASQQPQASGDNALQSQASPSQTSPPARVMPPLPRTRRAKINNPNVAPEAPVLPRRTLRSRSKTPAPPPASSAATVEPPSLVPPLPRRTTRSRTPSALAGTTAEGGIEGENVKPTRASSRPPSSESRTGRARSRSRSKPPSTGTKKATTNAKPSGLPAVHEQSDDLADDIDEPESKLPAILVEHPVPTFSQAPVEDGPPRSQTGFRSGVIHIPLPRRTRARSASQQQQSQQPPIPRPARIVEKEVKRELLEDVMDMDTQGRVQPGPESSQQGELDASQGASQSQGGYEEGYGFDMGSLVLQTQAPYKWSQSQ